MLKRIGRKKKDDQLQKVPTTILNPQFILKALTVFEYLSILQNVGPQQPLPDESEVGI